MGFGVQDNSSHARTPTEIIWSLEQLTSKAGPNGPSRWLCLEMRVCPRAS